MHNIVWYYSSNIYVKRKLGGYMPKVSLDMPNEILLDIKKHVGDHKKFVSVADAIRTACRKLLDQLDTIDERHGRIDNDN